MSEMSKFIDEQFQLGNYDRVQVFFNVCQKMGYELPEESTIFGWILNIDYYRKQRESDVLPSTFHIHYYELLSQIYDKYIEQIKILIDQDFDLNHYNRTHAFFSICQKLSVKEDLPKKESVEKRFRSMQVEKLINIAHFRTTITYIQHEYLYDIVNERFWQRISFIIKEFFQQRKTETETFSHLTRLLNYDEMDAEKVKDLFDSYKIDRFPHDISIEYRRLVEKISQDYMMYGNVVFSGQSDNGGQLLGDEVRYQCKYYRNQMTDEQQIKLTDLYHDQTRQFIGSDISTKQKGFKFVQLNSNRLLFISDNGQRLYISLVQLNLDSSTFELLDTKRINSTISSFRIIFDTMDKRRFAIFINNHMFSKRAFLGLIKDEKSIEIKKEPFYEFDEDFFCYELEANKMIGLKADYDDDRHVIERVWFWEQRIVKKEQTQPVSKFEFEFVDYCNEGQTVSLNDYAWSGDVCYTVSNIHSIHAFDINTKRCTEIHFKAIGYARSPLVDQMNCLLLRNENYVYRFAMRKPDTFLNIVWFEIRRQKMFFNKKIYENALKVAPLKLQPFYIEN